MARHPESFCLLRRLHWLAGLCMFGIPAFGQNLVPNPSFETISECPSGFSVFGNFEAPPWQEVMGTADAFHACADPVWRGVPKNFQGYQPASTGIAYAGGYFKSTNLSREYVQAELLQPLEADVCYRVGCRINLSN